MTHEFASASATQASAPQADTATSSRVREPLGIDATFCPTDVESPFDTTEWELRTAAIKGEDGKVLFEQPACEIPAAWSQLATNVVVSKYFYGEIHTPEREHSVKQLVHRVARTITDWGVKVGYVKSAEDGERFYEAAGFVPGEILQATLVGEPLVERRWWLSAAWVPAG